MASAPEGGDMHIATGASPWKRSKQNKKAPQGATQLPRIRLVDPLPSLSFVIKQGVLFAHASPFLGAVRLIIRSWKLRPLS